MPNHCTNTLNIKGASHVINTLERAAETGQLLNQIKPMPPELLDTPKGYFADTEKQRDMERKGQENLQKYGYRDWYDFAVAEWGTKWDIYDFDVVRLSDNSLRIVFSTAWAPPIEAYTYLQDMVSIDEFIATWFEPGCCFIGFMHSDGSTLEISIDEFTEQWYDDNIPPLLMDEYADLLFDMADNMEY